MTACSVCGYDGPLFLMFEVDNRKDFGRTVHVVTATEGWDVKGFGVGLTTAFALTTRCDPGCA